jgi:S-adenosylmethionine-diacylgycerolhomoserine-N-methlytransferase
MNAWTNCASDTSEENRNSMDRMYRLQRHIYDATRKYYLLGRDQMLRDLKCPQDGSILEIGCGTARNLAVAGKLYPDARLFGCDISVEMLKSAGNTILASGLERRARLAQADAVTFNPLSSFGEENFDCIYFSYTLSMIPSWEAALAHAASLLRPGGEMHVVDFGLCDGLPQLMRIGLDRWLARFGVKRRETLASAGRDIAAAHDLLLAFWHSHRGYAAHLTLFRSTGKPSHDCHKNHLDFDVGVNLTPSFP